MILEHDVKLVPDTYFPQITDTLTHCSLETHKRVIGKEHRPRSDAAESGI